MLKNGNDHSSRMTERQATDFASEWEVLSHQPSTATGFSATLFKYVGQTDAARGVTHGQLVVSFRSTEFVEDQVRDSKATNELEISPYGWAFGQIADMRTWWASVQPQISTSKVDLTGYSLGGHLATAFYELYGPARVNKVYTFNGAGVGTTRAASGSGLSICSQVHPRVLGVGRVLQHREVAVKGPRVRTADEQSAQS